MARIEDYGLIGDLQTAALVGLDGGIDWLCLPRFDSPACFAALLGDDSAGRWVLAPVDGGRCTERRYVGDSLVLETTWRAADGEVRVLDLMPVRGEAADVVRVVEGVSGTVRMRSLLRLRFDYGRVVPWIETDGAVTAIAGPDAVVLATSAPVDRDDGDLVSEVDVSAGQRVAWVLTHYPSWTRAPHPAEPDAALRETTEFWHDWVGRLHYEGRWPDAVRRSLVMLKALTDTVTGGVVAAVTTSLPEEIGGSRNWDYRYSWLRDAAFTLQALLGTGFLDEAAAWRAWLLRAVAGDPSDLQIMYALDGSRRIPEATLDWLPGYEGSTPVRIGNAASEQLQLDVWGEVLDALHLARRAGIDPSREAWAMQRALVGHVGRIWREPDNGLWEMRGPRRHFVHSKVLAWAGVDRMVQAVESDGVDGPVDEWRELREQIRDDVCAHGYDPDRGTFTQFYGSSGVDASLLLLPEVGFVAWDDPRFVGTLAAIEQDLVRDGLVHRYRTSGAEGDGLEGGEGAFLACNFWYADALWETGRTDDAVALFERLLGLANDLGILSEEYDVAAGRQLGNVPQAFSHVGLVTTARRLSGDPTARRESA